MRWNKRGGLIRFDGLPVENTAKGDEETHGDGGPGGTCFIVGSGDFDTLEDVHRQRGRFFGFGDDF